MTSTATNEQFVVMLRTYDEGGPPEDGWYIAYNDLLESADRIELLMARNELLEDVAKAARFFANKYTGFAGQVELLESLAKLGLVSPKSE